MLYYGEMPRGNKTETVRGPTVSFFYDFAKQLVRDYGDAMPGGTASLAKHVMFPASFKDKTKEGVLEPFRDTGRLGSIRALAGVDLFLDAKKAPDLYLWRFWLKGCVLDPRREDTGMVELSACSPHGYAVFAGTDSATAYYQDNQKSRESGFSVDVTDATWVLSGLATILLNGADVKNRLEQMLSNRTLRDEHLVAEGVQLDGDPYRLPLGLGYSASMRLEEYQRGFLSMIGYEDGPEEPIGLPKLVDLTDVNLALSHLQSFSLAAIGT